MIDTQFAFDRYESLRGVLPKAKFPKASQTGSSLKDTAEHFDAYILDAFGVLNRGETAIEGAVVRMSELRAAGKRLIVLTNAASYTRDEILTKYHRLGFDFTADEVVSSRDIAFANLPTLKDDQAWAAISAAGDDFSDAPDKARLEDLISNPSLFRTAGGFILLSTARWGVEETLDLGKALKANPRPLVIANPDLVAPREGGLTIEPGMIAHDIVPQKGVRAEFYGKPYDNAFDTALAKLANIPRDRVAMVGDTLHTDVLGGAAAGVRTILITDHGLFRGCDVTPFIENSGIRPDWIVETT